MSNALTLARLSGVTTSTAIKAPVRMATTGPLTSLAGFPTVDGVTFLSTDQNNNLNIRILVKDQADQTKNGIYNVQANNWTRAQDFDGNDDVVQGCRVIVAQGTVNQGEWVLTTPDPVYIVNSGNGVSNIVFAADAASFAASAAASAAAAAVSATSAATSATAAGNSATSASVSANTAIAAADAAGPFTIFTTKSSANSGLSGVPANAFVEVLVDESLGNARTVYQKSGGVYVHVYTFPSGSSSVTNVAGLQAVAPVANAVMATQGYTADGDGGGGTFLWSTSNHSTDVTNDPQHAIFIPPSSDTTGASGAWVRQYDGPVNLCWFGGNGDGSTDNAAALVGFNTWARARSAAGFGVDLFVPPGTYNFDHSQCFGFLLNIKVLHIVAYGVTFQNTYNQSIHGGNFGYELPWDVASLPLRDASNTLKSWFISTTAPGDTSVTTVTHSDASSSNFTVGDWVMIASLDIQYFGYPPNLGQIDFVKVVSVNSSTGVIALDRAVRYAHRSDFPDGPAGIIPCGKARVWQLNTLGWPQSGPTWPNGGLVTWDVDHTYEGMTVNLAPTSSITDVSLVGRRIRTINWTGAGHSESTAGTVIHENANFLYTCEPDKNVDRIEYRNCSWSVGVGFQSGSINNVIFTNPSTPSLSAGPAKYVLVDGGSVGILSVGGTINYGANRSTIIRGAFVRSFQQMQGVPAISGGLSISGDVAYSNGVFSIAQTFAGQQGNWNVLPGSQIYLTTTSGAFPKDIGVGTVIAITEDASFIYITTTFNFASLPAWANGAAFVLRGGVERYEGCTGCDGIVLASQATQAGHNPWDYFRYVWAGVTATSGSFFPGFAGQLEKFTIDVVQPAPVGSCTLGLKNFGLASTTDLTSLGEFDIITDISTAGKRIITRQSWFNKQSNDSMTLNSVSQSVVPTGLGGEYFWNLSGYTPGSYQPYQLPIIEMIWETDLGQYRKKIPAASDAGGGGPNTIANITGTFQA